MGGCICSNSQISAEELQNLRKEADASKEIDASNANDNKVESDKILVLLLGAGESGKSTVLKQMSYIYGTGFGEQARKRFIPDIFSNILESIATLVTMSDQLAAQKLDTAVRQENFASKLFVIELIKQRAIEDRECNGIVQPFVLNEEITHHFRQLWNDEGIQATFENRSSFHLSDSTPFYFSRIEELGSPDYIPSDADVLRTRVRTTGVVRSTFDVSGVPIEVIDVGGQKSERRKWIHVFDNVTSVIFVAAISEYDQTMWEDSVTNRVTESISLFQSVASSKYFKNASIVLFLNKMDLFLEKLFKTPISALFPDAAKALPEIPDPCDSAAVSRYVDATKRFVLKKYVTNCPVGQHIFVHFTCATDTENVRVVLRAVKDTILRTSLANVGLVY